MRNRFTSIDDVYGTDPYTGEVAKLSPYHGKYMSPVSRIHQKQKDESEVINDINREHEKFRRKINIKQV